jgi:hypothetical protein
MPPGHRLVVVQHVRHECHTPCGTAPSPLMKEAWAPPMTLQHPSAARSSVWLASRSLDRGGRMTPHLKRYCGAAGLPRTYVIRRDRASLRAAHTEEAPPSGFQLPPKTPGPTVAQKLAAPACVGPRRHRLLHRRSTASPSEGWSRPCACEGPPCPDLAGLLRRNADGYSLSSRVILVKDSSHHNQS